jgi:hypothetical protein
MPIGIPTGFVVKKTKWKELTCPYDFNLIAESKWISKCWSNADAAVEIYNQEEFVSILISELGNYGIAEIIMQK